jgi:hypothetical protein
LESSSGRRRPSRALSILAALLILVGSLVGVGAAVAYDDALDSGVYTDALVESHAYTRVYTEVLTDPQVRAYTDGLLRRFVVGGRSLADTTALSNAFVRLALPPAVLRDITEEIVGNVLAYVRGESPRLSSRVTLVGAIERLHENAAVVVRDALLRTTTELLTNLDFYEAAVRRFADELASGKIPESIPVVGGNAISEEQIIDAIEAATEYGLPTIVRDQMIAAVRSGDDREALITAAAAFAREHLTALTSALRTGDELQLDYLRALGGGAAGPQREIIERLNSIRDALAWFPSWLRFVGLGLAAAGVALLVVVWRRRAVIGIGVGAAALLVSAGAVALVWRIVTGALGSPLVGATSAGTPPSVTRILRDLDRSVAASLDHAVARYVTLLVTAGLVTVAVGGVLVLARLYRRDRRRARAAAFATVVCLGATVWVLPTAAARPSARECNGHAELCNRPYDEVVQAATHNSMSSPDVVWIWPEQDGDIRTQLEAGVRTLLIDTKYWTSIPTPAALSTADQLLPPDLATSLFVALGRRTDARPGTYLCHRRCAYGAISFTAALRSIKSFLDDHPNEVVTLIIEDEITRQDTEQAFHDSGAIDMVYDAPADAEWPTLGALIDRGQRLVVFSENLGPPPDWYRTAFDDIEDTPFRVLSVGDLGCETNRGGADASLFLLNNWIQREAPDRADAVIVNDRDFIVERARRCQRERGRLPNFIAVNFSDIGDVVGAVDELNEF